MEEEKLKISIYQDGDDDVWIPVTNAKAGQPARAFLPLDGFEHDSYKQGLANRKEKPSRAPYQKGKYLPMLSGFQSRWLENTDVRYEILKKERYRGLTPTAGWVKVAIGELRVPEAVTAQNLVDCLSNNGGNINHPSDKREKITVAVYLSLIHI